MEVTICGPNLNDQSKGSFHVHAADCADLACHASREPEYRNGWTIEVASATEVAETVYSDQIAESGSTADEYLHDFHFFPCTDRLEN